MHKLSIFALSVFTCLYFGACKTNDSKELSHHHHEHQHEAHEHGDHHHHAENYHSESDEDEDEITLSPAMAERFGVTTETVQPSSFTDALKVSGEILSAPTDAAVIVAPTSGIITLRSGIERGSKISSGSSVASIKASGVSGGDRNQVARAALDAAKRELDRLTPLYKEKLVTAGVYNEALRTYEEAKGEYSSTAAAGSVTSPISGVITSIDVLQGQYVEVGTPIATVSGSTRMTLRADVPQRYYNRVNSFNDALLTIPYSNVSVLLSDMGGKRAANAVAAAGPGYVPVYFTFDNNGDFLPGAGVDVYLQGNSSGNIISVPVSALSEQQGLYYVFVKLDDECYRKVPVILGRNNGRRVEIKSGLMPGDDVVITGATTVRIAESSGAVPEGHTHNH